MVFTIFHKTGEIHFDHNGLDDYDGDKGYYDEINISDERVHSDVEDMIIDCYFIAHLRQTEQKYIKDIKQVLHRLLRDMDCYEKAIELFYDELKEKYQSEYGNGN